MGTGLLILVLAASPFVTKGLSAALLANSYVAQSAYKVLQLAVPAGWRWRVDRKRGWASLWPIDEPAPSIATWAFAVAIACLLAGTAILLVLVLAPFLDIRPEDVKQGMDAKFSMTATKAIGVVLYLLTINAALEELHFRAWLDRELSRRFGSWIGITASAATFAAMHLFIFAGMEGAGPVALALVFLGLATAGVSWSWLARRPGGIHAAWLSHGLTDAGLLTWGLFWLGYLG